jgi:hypothetical protein
VPRWIISGPGADLPNGLVISLTTGVTHSVIVYAWELNVNKSGSLDIVVIIKVSAFCCGPYLVVNGLYTSGISAKIYILHN